MARKAVKRKISGKQTNQTQTKELKTDITNKSSSKSTPGKGTIYKYYNCRVLRDHKIVRDNFYVRDGIIINPEKLFYVEKKPADVFIDCKNAIIAPGFIDIQINGAFGIDFSHDVDNIEKGLKTVANGLLPHGVTSFCPTVISSKEDIYRKMIPKIKKTNGSKDGAGILGIHLEGPYLSVQKKGAHLEENLRKFPNGFSDLLDLYGCLDDVAIVTIAPELERSSEVIQELVKRGITVSVGHTQSDLVCGEEAVMNGASCITHLFNAMESFHHRDPHLIGLLTSKFLTDRIVYYGLISDGIHTHPAAVRMAFRSHPRGFIIVTDAIPAMGLPIGKHHIGSQLVEIQGKKAVLSGTNTLCGSIATIPKCVQNLMKNTECTQEQALETATLHPAELLKITDRKGTLEYNTDADFIMLDDSLNVLSTYIAGELVWSSEVKDKVQSAKCRGQRRK